MVVHIVTYLHCGEVLCLFQRKLLWGVLNVFLRVDAQQITAL
jgi:hypothetical protein